MPLDDLWGLHEKVVAMLDSKRRSGATFRLMS
jgi:hypothetical protein